MSGALVPVTAPAEATAVAPYEEQQQRADATQTLVTRIKAAYTALPATDRPAKRAQFEQELAQAFAGTHKYSVGAPVVAAAPVAVPMTLEQARALIATSEASVDTGIPEGFVPIAGADLSGYVMPPEVAAAGHTHLDPSVVSQLRAARLAGVTQAQVSAVMLSDLG
jgi:hypothetical protein